MKILENFSLNTDTQFICTLTSRAAMGKTSVMVILASELAKKGKKILYITEEMLYVTSKRFSKIDINYKNIKIFVCPSNNFAYPPYFSINLIEDIFNNDNENYDFVFIDSPMINEKILNNNVFNFLKSKNCSIFVSEQTKRTFKNEQECSVSDYPYTAVALFQKSDLVINLTKITTWTFFEKLKNCLRIESLKNIECNIIKNRFGSNKKIKFNLNYENLKIK